MGARSVVFSFFFLKVKCCVFFHFLITCVRTEKLMFLSNGQVKYFRSEEAPYSRRALAVALSLSRKGALNNIEILFLYTIISLF